MTPDQEDVTWESVRGEFLHRAALHPATFRRYVETDTQRDQYLAYCSDFAATMEKALRAGDSALLRALASPGGPSRSDLIDRHLTLPAADQQKVSDSFVTAAEGIAASVMWKAAADGWRWIITEVASPYAYIHEQPFAGKRIDLLAKRSAKNGRPLIVVADLKTGRKPVTPETASTFVDAVVQDYGTWLREEAHEQVACTAAYASTTTGFTKWASAEKVVRANDPRTDELASLTHAYTGACNFERFKTGKSVITFSDFQVWVPSTVRPEVAADWFDAQNQPSG